MSDTQINAADARTFVSNFHPEPEAVAKMPDDQVLKYHARVNEFYSKGLTDAAAKAKEGLVPQTWPEKWRNEMAEDEKEVPQLERYATPKDVWKKARELEKRISSGEYKLNKPFPEKGTPEEQNIWRKEAGLPEAPEKYELKDKNGLPLKDEVKGEILPFLKHAHSRNIPPAIVNEIVNYEIEQAAAQEKADADEDAKEAQVCEDALRKQWGNENFRRNQSLVENFLASAPQALRDMLGKTRLPNGALMKNDPTVQMWMLSRQLEIDPVTTLTPNGSGNVATSLDDRIKAIEGWMKAPRGTAEGNKYWKDEKVQAEYRDLLSARERVQGRKAA